MGKKKEEDFDEQDFSEEEIEAHYDEKSAEIERILGPEYEYVGHAVIPFDLGGSVDMYIYPQKKGGTAFCTKELIQPDGSGPMPTDSGTYEIVTFTKHEASIEENTPFAQMQSMLCGLMTGVGNYSFEAVLNSNDTAEFPFGDDETKCLIFRELEDSSFEINGNNHHLLLVMEVHRSEMEYAMEHGTEKLVEKLKKKKFYPYSDLDREAVV